MSIAKLQVQESQPPMSAVMPTDMAAMETWFDKRLDERLAERAAKKRRSLAIIATKGTMDMAYPPFILATTAAALGWKASVFFTFYGLELLKKNLDIKVSPLGNPAMPMKMPFGPEWLRKMNMPIPNAVAGNLPGFETFATAMMERTVNTKGVPSIKDLRDICIESEVRLLACQMTVDLFSYRQDEFIPEIAEWIGATSYLAEAQDADVCLFV
jgi:peroxiredoxin family protein